MLESRCCWSSAGLAGDVSLVCVFNTAFASLLPPCEPRQLSAIGEMVSSWFLALLSLSAADGLRGGAMAGGPLLKSGAQSKRSEPVTPRAVVVLRGGGARQLRTHPPP